MQFDQSFLKDHRISHKLTQKYVADHVGTTQATISKIESGVMEINIDIFFGYCKLFKVSPSTLAKRLGWEAG